MPVLALALAGCSPVAMAFKRAQEENTLDAWSAFVNEYPPAAHPGCEDCREGKAIYDRMRRAKEDRDWSQAQARGTVGTALDFMASRPRGSPHYAEAKRLAAKRLGEGRGGQEDFLRYLRLFPDGTEAPALWKGLMRRRYEAAESSGDPNEWELFMSEYPGTSAAARIERKLAAVYFKGARRLGTRLAYEFILKRFPASSEAGEARSALAAFSGPKPVAGPDGVLKLLPKLRDAMPSLKKHECLSLLAATVRAAPNPYGARAEKVRGSFLDAAPGDLPGPCRDMKLHVPSSKRKTVANAVQALIEIERRKRDVAAAAASVDGVVSEIRELGKNSDQLAHDAEAFDMKLQALYGYMPTDPYHPRRSSWKIAEAAEQRAKTAFGLIHDAPAMKAVERLMGLMEGQSDLLINVIALYEKPVVAGGEDP